LELAIKARLHDGNPFFFVQIGANDGRIDDPIYKLISRYQLKGLLIEPVPDFFKSLVENYKDNTQLLFENSAIGNENGMSSFYKLRNDNPFSAEARGLAGFDKDILLKHEKFIPGVSQYIETISVKTITLQSLIDKYRLTHIDLLQVDTEGYDYEILKMVFSTKIRPHIINYEFVHLTPSDQNQSLSLLAKNGYKFINTKKDTLAIRSEK
jgi:FkbM family methyltransferase